jgi:hypothetical protein
MRARILLDFARFKSHLPADIAAHARDHYRVDPTGWFAGRPVRLPFGKGAGQLSMTAKEVRADAEAGLGFVVLKTVIAQDAAGAATMAGWAIHESAMDVGPRVSRTGRTGWTVTWKGRGWDRPFDDYLALYREARAIGEAAGMPVAASVKYHLPPLGAGFQEPEYAYTTARLAEIGGAGTIIEKDFSPTLAADDRSAEPDAILRWIREVPALIKRQAPVTLGMKLMNALFDDDFQVEMLDAAARNPDVDFVTLFNRLWDPEQRVAYGGWDLSDRNLRVLDRHRALHGPVMARRAAMPGFTATGNIGSGRMMVEYGLRGATSGQIHTFFQLPRSAYAADEGSATARALHALLYHPEEGLLVWMVHLGETGDLQPRDGLLHFLDLGHGPARHPD